MKADSLNNSSWAAVELVAFDFDGVFTDNTVYVSQDGIETVRCWRGDGLGLSRLATAGVHIIIISTEKNPVVMARAKKLGVPCMDSVVDKALALTKVCKRLGVSLVNTAFVGNDINDIPAFNIVGFPVAVADAHPEASMHALYCTTKTGGHGVVREICDLIYFSKKN